MADGGQRTEQPTHRRLEKARREGRFPLSRDFVAAMQFAAIVAAGAAFAGAGFAHLRRLMRELLAAAFRGTLTRSRVVSLFHEAAWPTLAPLLAVGGALALVALGVHFGVTRFGVSLKKLSPDLARLDPVRRLRELPRQNLPIFFQALVLLPLFAAAVYAVAADNWNSFLRLPLGSVESGVGVIAVSVKDLAWKACALFLALGCVDLFRQKRRHASELRMTKQEVREELKEVEGNPQIKLRIRRLQRDLLRRRMMNEVPKATAVVVNPTHYAVAIRYRAESMAAPMVVAKGRNYLAQRIRQRAIEHQVPVVENPPLAQALYKYCDVGREIPAHLYRAVAEILAYIYRLMNGRLPG